MKMMCFALRNLIAVCPKLIVALLCAYCVGAMDSIISDVARLHRSGFNLEFETLHESI